MAKQGGVSSVSADTAESTLAEMDTRAETEEASTLRPCPPAPRGSLKKKIEIWEYKECLLFYSSVFVLHIPGSDVLDNHWQSGCSPCHGRRYGSPLAGQNFKSLSQEVTGDTPLGVRVSVLETPLGKVEQGLTGRLPRTAVSALC